MPPLQPFSLYCKQPPNYIFLRLPVKGAKSSVGGNQDNVTQVSAGNASFFYGFWGERKLDELGAHLGGLLKREEGREGGKNNRQIFFYLHAVVCHKNSVVCARFFLHITAKQTPIPSLFIAKYSG